MAIEFDISAINFKFLAFISDIFGLKQGNSVSHAGYFSPQNLSFVFLLQ